MVGAPHFNFSAMAAHVVRVLTVLAERIREGCSHTTLGERSGVLLLEHVLLFSELLEPVMLECL